MSCLLWGPIVTPINSTILPHAIVAEPPDLAYSRRHVLS